MSSLSDLKSKINGLKNDYETNVNSKYATMWMNSEIYSKDNEVMVKLIEFYNTDLSTLKKNLSTVKTDSIDCGFSNIANGIMNIHIKVQNLENDCEDLEREIRKKSSETYNRVNESFKEYNKNYEMHIDNAASSYKHADSYYRYYFNSKSNSEDGIGNTTFENDYKKALQNGLNSYALAKTQYKALVELIDHHGLKKSDAFEATVAPTEETADSIVSDALILSAITGDEAKDACFYFENRKNFDYDWFWDQYFEEGYIYEGSRDSEGHFTDGKIKDSDGNVVCIIETTSEAGKTKVNYNFIKNEKNNYSTIEVELDENNDIVSEFYSTKSGDFSKKSILEDGTSEHISGSYYEGTTQESEVTTKIYEDGHLIEHYVNRYEEDGTEISGNYSEDGEKYEFTVDSNNASPALSDFYRTDDSDDIYLEGTYEYNTINNFENGVRVSTYLLSDAGDKVGTITYDPLYGKMQTVEIGDTHMEEYMYDEAGHMLKIYPNYYDRTSDGTCTFKSFGVGELDPVEIEYNPENKSYSLLTDATSNYEKIELTGSDLESYIENYHIDTNWFESENQQ